MPHRVSDHDRKVADLEARQDDVIRRLDQLERQIKRAIADFSLEPVGQPGVAPLAATIDHGLISAGPNAPTC